MPTAFLLQPPSSEFEPVRLAISAASGRAGVELLRVDLLAERSGFLYEQISDALQAADLVIADVSGANSDVMYQLGFAHAANKPVLLVSGDTTRVPFDIMGQHLLHYRRDEPDLALLERVLSVVITEALNDPNAFAGRPAVRPEVNRLFISYSHRDSDVLARLLVHLRPLEREGLIDAWNDTVIEAGADWIYNVEDALAHARAAILLVTADFLASDFIVDNELPPLLEAAEGSGTRIIPLIVKPCRYVRDQRLRRLQAINDPSRPLVSLPEAQQEQLFDDVAATVERAMSPTH